MAHVGRRERERVAADPKQRAFETGLSSEPPEPFGRKSLGKEYASASSWEELPSNTGPSATAEVALVGRSNVGKSTLLNALLSLSREQEALAAYDRLTGDQPTIEELSTSSGTASTASPEPSGKAVPQHGQSGQLAVTPLGSRATSGRAWWL